MFTSARTLITRAAPLVITALSVALSANLAFAAPPTSSTVVQYRELDLSTEAGVQALYERIKTAASQLCWHETVGHSVIDKEALYLDCYKEAVANGVTQIGQARLTAIHRADSRLAVN